MGPGNRCGRNRQNFLDELEAIVHFRNREQQDVAYGTRQMNPDESIDARYADGYLALEDGLCLHYRDYPGPADKRRCSASTG